MGLETQSRVREMSRANMQCPIIKLNDNPRSETQALPQKSIPQSTPVRATIQVKPPSQSNPIATALFLKSRIVPKIYSFLSVKVLWGFAVKTCESIDRMQI